MMELFEDYLYPTDPNIIKAIDSCLFMIFPNQFEVIKELSNINTIL